MDLMLVQKQEQQLSPQTIQSLEILQMSAAELEQYLDTLLLENPVLERERISTEEEGSVMLDRLEWHNAHSRQTTVGTTRQQRKGMESAAFAFDETLYEHLAAQINWSRLSPAMQRGVTAVLSGLNDSGYLEETTEELALRGGVSRNVLSGAERLVQQLEPPGVGARSLSQCLVLQLNRMDAPKLATVIAENYLEEMAQHHYHRIAQCTDAGREEIQAACDLIRTLQPRPGGAFAPDEHLRYVEPDVVVEKNGDDYEIYLTDQREWELTISSEYLQMLQSSEDAQVREYLTDKVRQANWVIQCISQRKSTLLRCAEKIVALQRDFFDGICDQPRPMTQSELAELLGVHSSTVSRAIREKYLQCRRGLFPLRRFFSAAVGENSETVSAATIKQAIRKLIDGEDVRRPLSDQKLSVLLEQQGYTIARRTVAKYREEMNLASATGRKKFL